MGGTTVFIDISVVFLRAIDEFDFGAEFFKNLGTYDTGGAIGAVHTDMKTVKIGWGSVVF